MLYQHDHECTKNELGSRRKLWERRWLCQISSVLDEACVLFDNCTSEHSWELLTYQEIWWFVCSLWFRWYSFPLENSLEVGHFTHSRLQPSSNAYSLPAQECLDQFSIWPTFLYPGNFDLYLHSTFDSHNGGLGMHNNHLNTLDP